MLKMLRVERQFAWGVVQERRVVCPNGIDWGVESGVLRHLPEESFIVPYPITMLSPNL
jgi:hypothetical protein